MAHHLMYLRMLDGAASLANPSVKVSSICTRRTHHALLSIQLPQLLYCCSGQAVSVDE